VVPWARIPARMDVCRVPCPRANLPRRQESFRPTR
jgi:hypothetical protein